MKQSNGEKVHTRKEKQLKSALWYGMLGLFLFFLIVFQSTWAQGNRLFGVVPDLAFVFCVCFGVCKSGALALFVSAFCGFLQDVCAMHLFFYHAFLYLYISAGSVWLSRKVFCFKTKAAVVLVFFATLCFDALLFSMQNIVPGAILQSTISIGDMLLKALYHMAGALILYPVAAKFAKGCSHA